MTALLLPFRAAAAVVIYVAIGIAATLASFAFGYLLIFLYHFMTET